MQVVRHVSVGPEEVVEDGGRVRHDGLDDVLDPRCRGGLRVVSAKQSEGKGREGMVWVVEEC